MRWTLKMTLDHADELADRFEAFDPSEATEIPIAEYALQRLVRESPRNEAQLIEAVTTAREAGTSWARIGEIVGVSGQNAERWHRGVVEPLEQPSEHWGPSLG